MIPFLLIGAGAYLLYDAQTTKMAKGGLAGFDISKLDPFESMQYKHLTEKSKLSKEDALGVIINNVEGDYSQLSKKLASLAKQLYDIPTKQMTLFEDGGPVLGWRVMYMRNIKTRGGEMMEIMQDNDVFTGTLENAKIFAENEMRSNNADKVIIKDPVDKVRGAVIKKSDIV